MKASEIMLDESLPHGTREGYAAGCKGSHCPGTDRLGMTCRQASIRYASDLSYRRRVDGGLSVEAIWAEDQLDRIAATEATHEAVADQYGNVYTTPSVTVSDSQTPIPEVPRRPKWSVRKAWIAIDPAGVMHGPFDSQELALASSATAPATVPVAAPSSGKRHYVRFSEAQREQMVGLHAEGQSDAEIAAAMGVKRDDIAQRRRKLGLPANTSATITKEGTV